MSSALVDLPSPHPGPDHLGPRLTARALVWWLAYPSTSWAVHPVSACASVSVVGPEVNRLSSRPLICSAMLQLHRRPPRPILYSRHARLVVLSRVEGELDGRQGWEEEEEEGEGEGRTLGSRTKVSSQPSSPPVGHRSARHRQPLAVTELSIRFPANATLRFRWSTSRLPGSRRSGQTRSTSSSVRPAALPVSDSHELTSIPRSPWLNSGTGDNARYVCPTSKRAKLSSSPSLLFFLWFVQARHRPHVPSDAIRDLPAQQDDGRKDERRVQEQRRARRAQSGEQRHLA